MSEARYEHRQCRQRAFVLYQGRPLGALSRNSVRQYIFPLYTPAGVGVLAECPPDHMHQQGLMVGQDLINGHNFWAMLHAGKPLNTQAAESTRPPASTIDEKGLTFELDLCWRTADAQSILQESRRVHFQSQGGFNIVDVTSKWTASYGDLYLGKTKEGGMGMRLTPALETEWGGQIRSSTGKLGADNIHETHAEWTEVFGKVGPSPVGVVMMQHPSQEQIPWFTRDYGLHLLGPMRHQARRVKAGESVTWRVGYATYDGISDGTQAAKAWDIYRQRD
jgi:hypothetical protein